MKEFIAKYGILIVAVLALAQPWLLAIWRKFFRKGEGGLGSTYPVLVDLSSFI